MTDFSGKRLLLLGGSGSTADISRFARENNVTLIATAPPRYGITPLKRIAQESYDADAADGRALAALIREKHIDGIFPGNNEDIMPHGIAAAEACGLPFYCTRESWDRCANKAKFKDMCRDAGIPVAKTCDPGNLNGSDIGFPVAVKPADSSGSQGFSVCREREKLAAAVENARRFSRTDTVLIEEYIPWDSSIIHYTLLDGEAYFCGISDKRSGFLADGAGSVMALQTFPSRDTQAYLDTLDRKVKDMFRAAGLHDGPLWIEAFNSGGRFIFNEMGYRFGGSMTYYPVRYFYGFDQLEFMLRYALGDHPGRGELHNLFTPRTGEAKNYAILPLHVRPGKIRSVTGEDKVLSRDAVYAYVPIHGAGDVIGATASVQQVFCYLHVLYRDEEELSSVIDEIRQELHVTGEDGEELLFQMYRFHPNGAAGKRGR